MTKEAGQGAVRDLVEAASEMMVETIEAFGGARPPPPVFHMLLPSNLHVGIEMGRVLTGSMVDLVILTRLLKRTNAVCYAFAFDLPDATSPKLGFVVAGGMPHWDFAQGVLYDLIGGKVKIFNKLASARSPTRPAALNIIPNLFHADDGENLPPEVLEPLDKLVDSAASQIPAT